MRFPIMTKPYNNFLEYGQWSFGASRDAGQRAHAGIDLYCPEKTIVYAMESGKVWNSYDNFYLETGCVEIIGSKYIIRYAEIEPCVKSGQMVSEGFIIGKVKKCKGMRNAMLHLEIYQNILDKSPLTNRENKPFQRRKDLINPTSILILSYNNVQF